MSGETMNVALSAATLIVVAAAAIAAVVQLKHLRASNQLTALLAIMNQWNSPTVQEALNALRRVPEKLKDPDYVAVLKRGAMRAEHPEFLALDLWEQIATFSKHGLIDERVLLDISSSQVLVAWRSVQPAIPLIRERGGPSAFENFEYLAVRARLWEKRHPDGTYPSGMPRMSELES
jgi:hypothetical protein